MRLKTRLTERFGLDHPILSAPMALAAGGALAAAVTRAGGLGLIGGGYGNAEWLDDQLRAAGNTDVGCGFITWSLAQKPWLLTKVLRHRPKLLMLSFGDPYPFASEIAAAGVPLMCQCQSLADVRAAVAAGAAVVVAQGAEAGGHGQSRGTLTIVPEAADLLRRESPETLLVAAGGIADGRGLAAALTLGADGVLMGTRFWATREALVHANHHAAILASGGDATTRTRVPDKLRRLAWPARFSVRVLDNALVRRWEGRDAELDAASQIEAPRYAEAFAAGDVEEGGVFFGEAAGMIDDVPPASEIVVRTVAHAADILGRADGFLSR